MNAPEICVVPGCGGEVAAWRLCETDLFTLIGMCLGKKRLPAHWPGELVKEKRERGLSKYRCLVCGSYHLGVILPDQAERTAAAEKIIRDLRRAGEGWQLTVLAAAWEDVDRSRWKAQWAAQRSDRES